MAIKKKTKPQIIASCSNCGVMLNEGEEIIKNEKYYCSKCANLEEKNINVFLPPQGFLRFLIYLFSFFIPIIGFLIGSIYYSQKDENNKNFGKICFIVMASGIIIGLLLLVISELLFNGMTTSQFNIGEGYY